MRLPQKYIPFVFGFLIIAVISIIWISQSQFAIRPAPTDGGGDPGDGTYVPNFGLMSPSNGYTYDYVGRVVSGHVAPTYYTEGYALYTFTYQIKFDATIYDRDGNEDGSSDV